MYFYGNYGVGFWVLRDGEFKYDIENDPWISNMAEIQNGRQNSGQNMGLCKISSNTVKWNVKQYVFRVCEFKYSIRNDLWKFKMAEIQYGRL